MAKKSKKEFVPSKDFLLEENRELKTELNRYKATVEILKTTGCIDVEVFASVALTVEQVAEGIDVDEIR